jgi:hypothetical protein
MAPAPAALFPPIELPDPCLLAVMQCCASAGDLLSLFSASRTHSKLHEAAVAALHSMTAHVTQQQQADSLLLYLARHAQHVDSVEIRGADDRPVALRQLPHNLLLHSLCLDNFGLQLQPGGGCKGVLGTGAKVAALKQLQLSNSELLGGDEGLAATMEQLPTELEALAIHMVGVAAYEDDPLLLQHAIFPFTVLQRLQHLTRLGLGGVGVQAPDLSALQPLTRLVDLALVGLAAGDDSIDNTISITANMLSGMQRLTCLELISARDVFVDDGTEPTVLEVDAGEALRRRHPSIPIFVIAIPPLVCCPITMISKNGWREVFLVSQLQVSHVCIFVGVLAGKTRLRDLTLQNCTVPSGAAGVSQLLSHLQPMQQLSFLSLKGSMSEGGPSAPAYSAVTAGSQLHDVIISGNVLPAGVWQHLFPAGRRLPHLTCLEMSGVLEPSGGAASAPKGSRQVSCCPGLQSLDVRGVCHSVELLGPLQGLSGLHTLRCKVARLRADKEFEAVCQLTGLRELDVSVPRMAGKLLQLTQLSKLTALNLAEGRGAQEVIRCQVR